ncbi:MAG: (2Fe-2S)-binding protein [Cellvibrionaceae bacterium]|nr:(2Fe-2S)-binding protein [Cellvibrionaceae bacterium]
MPLIFYVTCEGDTYEAEAAVGTTLMEAARANGIDGIRAECGGAMRCATCHCYIDAQWQQLIGPAQGAEADMLAATQAPRANSRLSCQVTIDTHMDGLIVHLPASQ